MHTLKENFNHTTNYYNNTVVRTIRTIRTLQAILMMTLINGHTIAKEIGNLPLGYEQTWTARLLFNSEGGYAGNTTNIESDIHGWSKLYEAQANDVYKISMPTAVSDPDNGIVQFKTPITIQPDHTYKFQITLRADKAVSELFLALSENEDDSNELFSKTLSLEAGKGVKISRTGLKGTDIGDMKLALGIATEEENNFIHLSGISLYDETTQQELWIGTSYYNYCFYRDEDTWMRIKDMQIEGRVETLSWTSADFDDSMWTEAEMPIGNSFSDVDSGMPICCFRTSSRTGLSIVELAINSGSFASTMKIAEKQTTEEEPGFKWIFSDGLDESVAVQISLTLKQGYAQEFELHQLGNTRSNSREDYAQLTDAEYANFRAVETTGMGSGTLYRSSSPVNPMLNRDKEADAALLNALVRTVINMADSDAGMRLYADYALKHYSACDIIALDMGMDYTSDDYREKLANGLRYLASHDGPYLIHCNEGKDRTGFAIGILECLMGADADEIVSDYMLTYYNFYGIEPGSTQYEQIAASNIEATLAKALAISSIRDDSNDLSRCAEVYLTSIGMSRDEIAALKEKLAKNYGGIADP